MPDIRAALPDHAAGSGCYPLADLLFLLAAGVFALLACHGIIPVSGAGVIMDSDLQTYAQGMAGSELRDLFRADPALHAATPANSIPNLERLLGALLAPSGHWAVGLLRAGAIAIFIFYVGWYLLGRWLYRAPSLAALLAVASGITVWVGWGTFWGVAHSDPVPRVFFGALLPFLILLAMCAINRAWLRPPAMLLTGCAIWIHGVSALNCGAMFFCAFVFLAPPGQNKTGRAANLLLCLAAFLAPVLLFLWPSLFQGKDFPPDELAVFHELFELRWHEDYGKFWQRLATFFSPSCPAFPILAGALAGWLLLLHRGTARERLLCKMAPCFLLALLGVAIFSWLETEYAPALGRLPMGHELVRGLRFLVPVSWLLITGGIGCIAGKKARRLLLVCAIAAIICFARDRQIIAAQYALSEITGIGTRAAALAGSEREKAESLGEVIETVRRTVPAGEAVYCPEDAMPVRYMALRPLAHSFKDGYLHFYNKDLARSKKWLELERLAGAGPDGKMKAWRASGAPWLLIRKDAASPPPPGETVMDKNGWLLIRASARIMRP